MTPAERIIASFDGVRKLAAALGHRNPTTVQGWKSRGFIPARQMKDVLSAAERAGIEITAEDFIGVPPSTDQRAAQ